MSQTRRNFLTTTLTGTAVMLTQPLVAFQSQTNTGEIKDEWYLKMRKCAQHNFNEHDPVNLDIDFWVNYWSELKVDALIITAGGFIAMYPTRLHDHYKSQFLGSRDLFGDYLKALKKKGIRVVARIETNFLHKDIFPVRPEWFERNADGTPRQHSETPWVYRTCLFSNYRDEQVPKIINEITSMYDVDGFFTNSWPQVEIAPHLCYCDNCKKLGDLNKVQVTEKSQMGVLPVLP